MDYWMRGLMDWVHRSFTKEPGCGWFFDMGTRGRTERKPFTWLCAARSLYTGPAMAGPVLMELLKALCFQVAAVTKVTTRLQSLIPLQGYALTRQEAKVKVGEDVRLLRLFTLN